jgi:hypothetical protein
LELKSIEHTLNDLADAMLPLEKMSPKERKELDTIEREMARSRCVTLKEVKSKYEVKKRAKIHRNATQ